MKGDHTHDTGALELAFPLEGYQPTSLFELTYYFAFFLSDNASSTRFKPVEKPRLGWSCGMQPVS